MKSYDFGIINNEEIIEGLVASIVLALTSFIFKYYLKTSYLIYASVPWFITWVFRKMSVHVFKKLNEEKYINNKLYIAKIPLL